MLKALIKAKLIAMLGSITKQATTKRSGGRGVKILFLLLMLYAYGCIAVMFGMLYDSLCLPFLQAGLGYLYFSIAWIVTMAFAVVLSLFTAQNLIYQAKDNEMLLSMPIPPRYILISRISVLWLTNLLMTFVTFVPAGVVYIRNAVTDTGWIIRFVFSVLMLPFTATALASLAGWLLSLITSRIRRKTLFSTLITLAFLGVYFTIYSQMNVYIEELINNAGQVASMIQTSIFPAYHFGQALFKGYGMSVYYTLLCGLGPFALACWLLTVSFTRIVTTSRGTPRSHAAARSEERRSLASALFRKEMRRLLSSSNYLINAGLGLIMSIVLPILLLVKLDSLNELLAMIPEATGLLPAIAAAMLVASASMVFISAPSVSLEGKHFWITRSYPIPARRALEAKAVLHVLLGISASLIGAILCWFALKVNWLDGLLLVALPVSANLFFAPLGVCINLRYPRLDWQNEAMVVKQSMSVMLTMLIGFATMIGMVLLYVFVCKDILSYQIYLALWCALFLSLGALCFHDLRGRGAKLFEHLADA